MKLSKVWVLIIVLLVAFGAYVFFGPSQKTGTAGRGQLDIAQAEGPDILDPARTVYPMAQRINILMYESLLTYDENQNLTGLLAKDWHYNEKGRYYEFELKRGIEFHNGEPLTAKAVEYSIERISKMPGSKHADSTNNILDVSTADNYTARVYLKENDRFLLSWFASISSAIVSPRASWNEKSKTYNTDFGTPASPPVGTGPFKFEKWMSGDRIVLSRYEEYNHGPEPYQNKGPAHLNRIVFHVMGTPVTREQKFESGAIDFVTHVRQDKKLINRWENNDKIKVAIQPGPSLVYLGFNCQGTKEHGHGAEQVAASVPRTVRRAVAYAINENELINGALAGAAARPESWLATSIWGSKGYQEQMYPYNPSKAEELLQQTQWDKKNTLSVMTTSNPRYISVLSIMESQLDNVGLNMEINQLQFTALESRVKNKTYDAFIMGYTWPLADMIWWEWHTVRLPSPNRFWWGDPYTDNIIERTFSMNDNIARQALYKAQKLIAKDAASIGLYERALIMAYRQDQLKNFEMPPLGDDTWKFLDARMAENQK